MPITYSPEQIRAHAVQLGLIPADADQVPQNLRSTVVASLHTRARLGVSPPPAEENTEAPASGTRIEVRPGEGGTVLVDGAALPWLAPGERIDVALDADGGGTVRLTLRADTILIHPATSKENRT